MHGHLRLARIPCSCMHHWATATGRARMAAVFGRGDGAAGEGMLRRALAWAAGAGLTRNEAAPGSDVWD